MMSKEFKRYKARIFGELYPIVSDEEESAVLDVVHRVDALMNDIASKYDSSDTKKIAVLTALKATEELVALQNKMQHEQSASDKIMTLIDNEEFTF